MKWIRSSLKRKVLTLLVGCMTLLGIAIYAAESHMASTGTFYRDKITNVYEMTTLSSKLQLAFKTQVQEWKNVLLRGSDQADREKYWKKFLFQEKNIQELIGELRFSDDDDILGATLSDFESKHQLLGREYRKGYTVFLESDYSSVLADGAVRGIDRAPGQIIASMYDDLQNQVLDLEYEQEEAIASAESTAISIMFGMILLFLAIIYFVINHSVVSPISAIVKRVEEYGHGKPVDFTMDRFDEVGNLAKTLSGMQSTKQAAEKEQKIEADKNNRIKQALDVCNANVMMADSELNIVYLNDSVEDMFRSSENDLRDQLPDFDVDKLMGVNVDSFHENPSHQRNLLNGLKGVHESRIIIGGHTFDIVATPVWDNNERLGTVVEWDDITEALARSEREKAEANRNQRIKKALDVCNANVMMADSNLDLVYTNDSVVDMLTTAEKDIQKELPRFNANDLIGTNIDNFHKNPAHQRGLIRNLTQPYDTQLELGGRTFDLVASPVFSDDNERIGTVVEWQDRTEELARKAEEKRLSDENARVRLALDACSANTMIADNDFNIIYTNQAVDDMLDNAEADIRTDLPTFSANKVMGSNIDVFHKNPGHQRNMLSALNNTYNTEIIVGGRTFSLTANPITNEQGERIGTIVEWLDRTQEVAVEKEVDSIIESAAKGDLTLRATTDGKEGFFKELSMGLNRLMSISENVISDTARVLDAMAHGRLNERIEQDYDGVFGKLKADANETGNKLSEVIGKIRESAGTVATGSQEIAQGNTDLSQRTEEQASSLEETASSMEEMTSSVRQTSENAVKANELASNAQNQAAKGGEVVGRAVGAMEEINTSSKKIADIIGVIDEIAFQTNLLALNAAVEAARAGEQGKGFAVVAGEVRNLAQRSAGAAKEIKDLIRDSVDKVDNGTALVNESGQTLTEIVEAVERVTAMIKEISSAAEEQASGIEQVNKAISQMDEMTQQNAALVEEASAASENMQEQASGMLNLVGFFQAAKGSSSQAMGAVAANTTEAMASSQVAVQPAHHASSASAHDSNTKAAPTRPVIKDDEDDWQEF